MTARRVLVEVEFLPTGLRLSSPEAPGFAAAASTAPALVSALHRVRREADVAAYARHQGEVYDLAEHDAQAEETAAPPRRDARGTRCKVDAWQPQPDGSWRSPGGRRYRGNCEQVQQVIRIREALGLPTRAS